MSVANLIKEDMETSEFWVERAKLEFIVAIHKVMVEKNISKADLARRVGKSPAYITKVMSGDANLTIESMVMFSRCVGMRFSPTIHPEKPAGRNIPMPTTHYNTRYDEEMGRVYAKH